MNELNVQMFIPANRNSKLKWKLPSIEHVMNLSQKVKFVETIGNSISDTLLRKNL